MKSTVAERVHHGRITRRCFASALLTAALLLWCAPLTAQDTLPRRADDFDYAQRLSRLGLHELVIAIYSAEEAREGLTPKRKREIGELIADAYNQMAAAAGDDKTRKRYLALAKQKIDAMAKELGVDAVTPALNYRRAKILQTQGRDVAQAAAMTQDPERKKTLIVEGVEKFDGAAKLFEKAAADAKQAAGVNPANQNALIVQIQSELQRCWTAYYKSLLWEDTQPEFTQSMTQAERLFAEYAERYPNDMTVLSAMYGRGLSNKLLKNWAAAKENFAKLIQAIDDEEAARGTPIPEVHPIKARCRVSWAESAAALGEYDQALEALKKMFDTNDALARDTSLRDLGKLTKGRVLGGKAAKVMTDGDRDKGRDTYREAVKVLDEVVKGGGRYANDAKVEMARFVRAGQLAVLTPTARMAFIESLLRAKKYKEAIPQLRQIIDARPEEKISVADKFRAHRMLSQGLRYAGDYDGSIKEYRTMLARYGKRSRSGIPDAEMAKVGLQRASAILAALKAHPRRGDLKQEYKAALKTLAEDYPNTPEGADALYYRAEATREDARSAEDYEEAAAMYARVNPAATRYGRARYLEAICCINAYKQYETHGKSAGAKAQAAIKRATDILEKLLKTKPATPDAEDNWHMDAGAALADLYAELGRTREAERVLTTLDRMYPEAAGGDTGILKTRVNVYLRLNQPDKALAARDELAHRKGADVKDVFNCTMQIAEHAYRKSQDLRAAADAASQAGDNAKAKALLDQAVESERTAGKLLAEALPHVEAAAKYPLRGAKAIAVRSFRVKQYATAVKAVQIIETIYQRQNRDEDKDLWDLRIMCVECYEKMNAWPAEAKKLLERIEQHPVYGNLLDIKMLRARVLENEGNWGEALKIWNDLGTRVPAGSDNWFEVRYRRAFCYYKLGNLERARSIIQTLEALNPDMGGPEMKAKFLALKKLINR